MSVGSTVMTPQRRYTGPDRRRLAPQTAEDTSRFFVRTGTAVLAVLGVLAVVALAGRLGGVLDVQAVSSTVDAATMAVSLVVSALATVHWRLTADARALWVGVAFALLAVASVGVAELLPPAVPDSRSAQTLAWVRPASLLVVIGALAQALRTESVDARLRPLLLYAAAFAVVGSLGLVFVTFPGLTQAFASAVEPLPPSATSLLAPVVSATLWAVLASALCLVGLRERRVILMATGLSLYVLTLAELARAASLESGAGWLLVSAAARLIAVSVGLMGVTSELRTIFGMLAGRLHETRAHYHQAEQRHLQLAEWARVREHEARNALTAIEGATSTLERYRDRLDEDAREMLSSAVSAEIRRLQQLVSAEPAPPREDESVPVDRVLHEQAALARSRGVRVLVEAAPLRSHGQIHAVAEALQNLLANAERHAPGSPVLLRAERTDDVVSIRVEDRGPGVRADVAPRIFDRGVRDVDAGGSGIGLHVARELVRAQGGELLHEPTTRGTCFVMLLPALDGGASAQVVSS